MEYELDPRWMLELLKATKKNGEKPIGDTSFDLSVFAESVFPDLAPREAYDTFFYSIRETRRKGWTERRPTLSREEYQGEILTADGELILAALKAKYHE